MLFPESDSPLVKAWIVKRLGNSSDADADVLADYVLALLRHDGDIEAIRKLFENEIPDFLREDAAAFTDDVLQVVRFRAYLPGAPPPPPVKRQNQVLPTTLPPSNITPQPPIAAASALYNPAAPYPVSPPRAHQPQATALGQGVSRKRAYSDHDDVDIILTSRTPNSHPYKQARRGGSFGQRGGRYGDYNGQRSHRGQAAVQNFPVLPPGPGSYGDASLPFQPPIDAKTILENIQILQSFLPNAMDFPPPVYPSTAPPPRRRKQRCRDDAKGYCPRGSHCNFEHVTAPSYDPSPQSAVVDEYDPNNAGLALPPFGMPLAQEVPQLDRHNFQPSTSTPTNRQDAKKARKAKGRPVITINGPNYDKSKTTIVVQNIPAENLTEDQIRGYFGQFGKIVSVTLQKYNRLCIIKFDTWEAANAAWTSPKVIFDNRFVKVFWHKEEGADGPSSNGIGAKAQNGHVDGAVQGEKPAEEEPDFDLDEFYRKTVEAQKIHDEKMRKRQEIEQERKRLEERQKELRERQEEAKRLLEARLKQRSASETGSSSTADKVESNQSGKSRTQTEALRAQLAALEQEASQLGIDPDENDDGAPWWMSRGRGRGRVYRGRGAFPPRGIRGSYGYRGRGGTVEARHAAYAAYSLDNRPKVVALSGVDFTQPEHDEALRQYLFSVGEFKDVHTTPTGAHVEFKDRKTAEKFMFGISASSSIPGIEGKMEASWAKSAPATAKMSDGDTVMGSTLDEEQSGKEKIATGADNAGDELEEGEVQSEVHHGPDIDQRDMDYEAGEW
ncbi:hypothetical protein F5Y17DRAFT_444920 [Xylariaceae sp. FL0594]|nr:hypothetical protein F5Y17DRAFT_444920 [Xylariaceae sp. FL0594]